MGSVCEVSTTETSWSHVLPFFFRNCGLLRDDYYQRKRKPNTNPSFPFSESNKISSQIRFPPWSALATEIPDFVNTISCKSKKLPAIWAHTDSMRIDHVCLKSSCINHGMEKTDHESATPRDPSHTICKSISLKQRYLTSVPRHTSVTRRVRRCAAGVWGKVERSEKKILE
jgi:hypothetical protein